MAKIIIPKFTPDELLSATDGFSSEYEIGHGAFGTVYLGNLKRLRQKVAIKRLNKVSFLLQLITLWRNMQVQENTIHTHTRTNANTNTNTHTHQQTYILCIETCLSFHFQFLGLMKINSQ